jgi:hypothetical protein
MQRPACCDCHEMTEVSSMLANTLYECLYGNNETTAVLESVVSSPMQEIQLQTFFEDCHR